MPRPRLLRNAAFACRTDLHLTTEESLALQLRRRSFQLVLADLRVQGALIAATPGRMPNFAVCPCCGYPTLTTRGYYDTCEICFWDDDGQDDPDADEVFGGPNSDYSLSEARRNFIDGRTHYRPSDPQFARETASAAERVRLIAGYDELLPDVFPWSFIGALPRIDELSTALSERRFGARKVRRWRRAKLDDRRRADHEWEVWCAVAQGTLRPWRPFQPPTVHSHDAAVIETVASRIDALLRARLVNDAPELVHRRRGVYYAWSRDDRETWLTRYDGTGKLRLTFEPYDAGTLPEPMFEIADANLAQAIAAAIAEHFAPKRMPGV